MENQYAGFRTRFLAYVVDGFILSIICFGLGFSFVAGFPAAKNYTFLLYLPSLILGAAYFILFWMKDGQTLGHRVMAIKVIREDKQPIDFPTAFIRYIGYFVSSVVLNLGFLWIIFDSKKQGWADKMAKTVVVKTGEKPKTWIPVLLLFFWFFAIVAFMGLIGIGLLATGLLMKNNPKLAQQLQTEMKNGQAKNGSNKVTPQLTNNSTGELIAALPSEINKYRLTKNLKPLMTDPQICAYAQKRADYLSQVGKSDEGQQFYEDLANPNIANAYFNNFKTAGSLIVDVSEETPTVPQVIEFWASQTTSVMLNPQYTNGCVRGNDSFVVLITAEAK